MPKKSGFKKKKNLYDREKKNTASKGTPAGNIKRGEAGCK